MAIVGNNTNKTFFRITGVVFRCCYCCRAAGGLIPVDDRSRFTMRTQNVLIVMKYKQARLSLSRSQALSLS